MSSQIVKLNLIGASQVPAGANRAIAHGLNRTPDIVFLLAACGADISIGATAPDATNIYLTNGGMGAEDAYVLVIAGHSIYYGSAAKWVKKISVPAVLRGGADFAVAHGLQGTPAAYILGFGSGANVTLSATPPTSSLIYLVNANMGAEEPAELLVLAYHSIEGNAAQPAFARLTGNVAAGANVAVAHGLARTPSIVALGYRTHADVTVGATVPTATNIYLANGSGGAVRAYDLLVWAPHSIFGNS
jgi:hypothetical protein